MDSQKFLERILKSYENDFDIKRPYEIGEHHYDAYAEFRVTSAKYVLMKKAELWRAKCYEHSFFTVKNQLVFQDLNDFMEDVRIYMEPELVRKGEKTMEKDHMYTYITGVFISEHALPEEFPEYVKRLRFMKNYILGIRGYTQLRILVIDMENKKMYCNQAGKVLRKGYKKLLEKSKGEK